MANNLGSKVKLAWLKSVEAVGTSASNLASNAKLKVAEMNLETRRRELLTNVSLQAVELWQKGVELPEPLGSMLQELSETEEKLSVLRAQKYAKVPEEADASIEAQQSDCENVVASDNDEASAEAADATAQTDTEAAEKSAQADAEGAESAPTNEAAATDENADEPQA